MGRRKGRLEEVISKALYHDDPSLYRVVYRDFRELKEVGLEEFLKISEGMTLIPASRIFEIKKGSEVLYRKRDTLI